MLAAVAVSRQFLCAESALTVITYCLTALFCVLVNGGTRARISHSCIILVAVVLPHVYVDSIWPILVAGTLCMAYSLTALALLCRGRRRKPAAAAAVDMMQDDESDPFMSSATETEGSSTEAE